MSVNIFLPKHLFYAKINCDIYGEIQINDDNTVTYFVIVSAPSNASKECEDYEACQRLRHLGHILRAGPASALQQRDVSLSFAYDAETPNIYLDKLSIKPADAVHAYVFLYDTRRVLQMHIDQWSEAPEKCSQTSTVNGLQFDDLHMLLYLVQSTNRQTLQSKERSGVWNVAYTGASIVLEAMSRGFMTIMEWLPGKFIFKHTVFHVHYQEWKKFRVSKQRDLNILVDRIFGILFMIALLIFIPELGSFLMCSSHTIVEWLRSLLGLLQGNPVGLKLNLQLSDFLLSWCKYHVKMWDLFLDMIEPLVRFLLIPIALLGSMGLSYQLALLADLISLMGLHAYCFYVYASVLYKINIRGLRWLCTVMLGKRYNVLKKRLESYNYNNRQLYLTTIMFSCLLFLFPTVLVYYTVFTIVRLCIFSVYLFLAKMRRYILEFPLAVFCKWLRGSFCEIESLQLQHQGFVPSPLLQSEIQKIGMSVFNIKVNASSLSRVFLSESRILEESMEEKRLSIKNVFSRILEGTFR